MCSETSEYVSSFSADIVGVGWVEEKDVGDSRQRLGQWYRTSNKRKRSCNRWEVDGMVSQIGFLLNGGRLCVPPLGS